MVCAIDNSGCTGRVELRPDPCAFINVTSDGRPANKQLKNDAQNLPALSRPSVSTVNVKPEDFIAFQMSFVPEVEQVYVSRHHRSELNVVIVVNDRDRILNRKIFAYENAIINYFRHLRFDFHIIPRMNRSLGDIIAIPGTRVK